MAILLNCFQGISRNCTKYAKNTTWFLSLHLVMVIHILFNSAKEWRLSQISQNVQVSFLTWKEFGRMKLTIKKTQESLVKACVLMLLMLW
jgi:hypothetical protein